MDINCQDWFSTVESYYLLRKYHLPLQFGFYSFLLLMEHNQTTAIVLDKTVLVLSSWAKVVLLAISIVASFAVPFLLGHPQILVGILVNAFLVLGALHMKKYSLLPLIMLPSLGVLARWVIFWPFTMFLVYMIPLIRIGNFLLVWGMKYFYLAKSWNRFLALGVSAFIKFWLLFAVARVLVSLGFLPKIFLTTMWLLQLGTALAGGVLAIGITSVAGLRK